LYWWALRFTRQIIKSNERALKDCLWYCSGNLLSTTSYQNEIVFHRSFVSEDTEQVLFVWNTSLPSLFRNADKKKFRILIHLTLITFWHTAITALTVKAQAFNPSYWRNYEWEDYSLRPDQANSLGNPISTEKAGCGGMPTC
jgi:hypothetical protein